MYRGLLKYYLFTIVALFGAIFAADYYYKQHLQAPQHKQVELSILVNSVKYYCQQLSCRDGDKLPFDKVQLLNKQDIAFPKKAEKNVLAGEVVVVAQGTETFYYAILDHNQMLEFGPFAVNESNELDMYSVLFFSLLGLTVFAMLWPLFAEMWRIKEAAAAFAKNKDLGNLKLQNYRFFKPVSDTLEWMLHKIARLLALQMELTSTLSHELRTNISNLKFSIANLNNGNLQETKQQLKDDVNEIQELLDQYLSFAKQEHEIPELDLTSHCLSVTIEQYLDKVSQFSDKQVTFDIHDEHEVMVDMVFFSRAVRNILDNAFKYSNSLIAVQLFIENDKLVLQVDDDGQGLNADSIDELFIPFTRKTQTQFGYGLGLAITKKILHWHKGTIEAKQSDILGGACFQLKLPLTADN